MKKRIQSIALIAMIFIGGCAATPQAKQTEAEIKQITGQEVTLEVEGKTYHQHFSKDFGWKVGDKVDVWIDPDGFVSYTDPKDF